MILLSISSQKNIKGTRIKFVSNINKILNYHLSYYKKYYSKCLKASRLKNENLKTKLKFIKKNKIGLMNIGRETAIKF